MKRQQQNAIAALAAAGILWGLTVPLSKLSLAWLSPAWLTAGRFTIAAGLLGWMARRELRRALTWGVVGAGAVGFGGVVILQNAGIERTTVSAAAVVIGTVPVLVALLGAAIGRGGIGRIRWTGNVLALGGVSLLAGLGGGGTAVGNGLVFASSVISAAFVVMQPRVLAGRDPAAVTAVQFGAAATVAVPIALATGGAPSAPATIGTPTAFLALTIVGTVLPFWLFAAGQARVRPEVAGAYLNLEPLVGMAVGWIGFGERAGSLQILGMIMVLAGIALSTLSNSPRTRTPAPGSAAEPSSATRRSHGASTAHPPHRSRSSPAPRRAARQTERVEEPDGGRRRDEGPALDRYGTLTKDPARRADRVAPPGRAAARPERCKLTTLLPFSGINFLSGGARQAA